MVRERESEFLCGRKRVRKVAGLRPLRTEGFSSPRSPTQNEAGNGPFVPRSTTSANRACLGFQAILQLSHIPERQLLNSHAPTKLPGLGLLALVRFEGGFMDCAKTKFHLGVLTAILAIALFACSSVGERVKSLAGGYLNHSGNAVVLVADGVSPAPPPPPPPPRG
jgi:hypothetical protein